MINNNNHTVRILLVDDDKDFNEAIAARLKKRGYELVVVFTAEEALDKIKGEHFNAVIADIKLPDIDGIKFLEKVRDIDGTLPVILITGYASLQSAKEAVKLNASDYLLKPLENIDDLLHPLNKAIHSYRLSQENKKLIDALRKNINDLEKSEEKAKAKAEEWRNTFDSISDLIFILDKDNVITVANKAVKDFFNMEYEDIIGKKCHEIFHDSDAPLAECPFEMSKVSGKTHVEEIFDSHLGKWFLVSISPIRSPEGKFKGAVHLAQDITEIKKKNNSLAILHKNSIVREHKMIELKERIKVLEERLKSIRRNS